MLREKIKKTIVAFSLAELLVVLTFISFILVYELVLFSRKTNQYGGIYYNAYNTLKKVAYNVFADTYCPDPTSEDPDCQKGVRPFPDNHRDLCKRFAEYLNIPDGKLHCDTAQTVNMEGRNIGNDTLAFVTANANKFYISYKNTHKLNGETIEYFIVYVDINGNKAPNKAQATPNDKVYPDIVPFIVTRKGEVIPAGLPVYSKAYLTAKVRYPIKQTSGNNCSDRTHEERGLDSICYYSESMSFDDAVHRAWGNAAIMEFPLSYNAREFIDSSNVTMGFTVPESKPIANEKDSDDKPIYGCETGTDNCMVVIDESDKVRF